MNINGKTRRFDAKVFLSYHNLTHETIHTLPAEL